MNGSNPAFNLGVISNFVTDFMGILFILPSFIRIVVVVVVSVVNR